LVHSCALPARSGPDRWNAVVFSGRSSSYWFFSGDSRDGPGTLYRVAADDPHDWTVRAKVNYLPETGALEIQTTERTRLVDNIHITAHLGPGRKSGTGRVDESLLLFRDGDSVRVANQDAVILVDLPSDYWPKLASMRRCSEEAMAKAK
jgi:hypothetical protein